jgi:signal transduction histidine kinase
VLVTDHPAHLKFQIQRRVGLAGAAACAAIALLNTVVALAVDDVPIVDAVRDPTIVLLPGFAIVAWLTTVRDSKVLRFIQVLFFLVYALIVSATVDPGSLHGAIFGIYGLILGLQYGMFRKRFRLKMAAVLFPFAAVQVIGAVGYDRFLFHAAPAVVVFISLFAYLFWVVFAEEISAYSSENTSLRSERDKNQVFVKFGQNISGVVHNLKSTLMSIDGCIDVLAYANEREREELLSIQKSSTTKMIDMINNFMTAVKSYQRNEPETVALNRLVESSIEVLKGNRTLKHKLKISLDLEEPDTVRGAPMEIMQVIDNLVTNAAEAMSGTGRYHLSLSTRFVDERVCLSVADEGGGIERCAGCDHDDCLRCSQFAYGKSTKPDGVGIGMMYVRQIVSEMHGSLRVDSAVNSGTTVHLCFPYVPVESSVPGV